MAAATKTLKNLNGEQAQKSAKTAKR